jgi:hypothetical protein
MYEDFVSNTENDKIVENIFMILGYSMLTLIVFGTLLWAYYNSDRNQYMFISVFSLFVLLYAIIIIAIVVINKNNYDALSYTLLFGITMFVIFSTFFLCVFFILKSFNLISSSNSNTNIGTGSSTTALRMNPYAVQGMTANSR